MEYPKGSLIEFNIYGTTVKGIIVDDNDKSVIIKVTYDFLPETSGTEQSINKDHQHVITENKMDKEKKEKALKTLKKLDKGGEEADEIIIESYKGMLSHG